MPSFRAFAWASKRFVVLGFLAAAGPLWAEDLAFSVNPSTVTAGRTLSFSIQSSHRLRQARARVGERDVLFYPVEPGRWRALIGIDAEERPGVRRALITGQRKRWLGWKPFQQEMSYTVQPGGYPLSRIKLAPTRDALFTSGSVARDSARLSALYSGPGDPQKRWTGPFVWASTGIVSSVFGAQRQYGNRPPGGAHSGVDIANLPGTPILAPAPGRVVFADWLESFGHTVLLDHGQGVFSYYLHMESSTVRVTENLATGQILGRMGAEGVATGPHLHWSLSVGGVRVDPLEWVERDVP